MRPVERCPPRHLLEEFFAGTLGGEDGEAVTAHVSSCALCGARQAHLDAEQEELLADVRQALLGEDVELGLLAPRFERYRVLRRLGSGGMGVVFEAEQRSPRRTVALKVLRPGRRGSAALKRFEREAELLGRLDHPGVARVYEAGTYADAGGPRPFLAMELVEGRTLRDYLAGEQPPTEARLALFAAVCDAVQHAHQRGVVHRDLKPSNVLVGPGGRPKVVDFGIARATDIDVRRATLATEAGQLVGTLAYMSPEQAAGDPGAVDTRADVYALGALLHEMLAGRPPRDLEGLSVPAALRAIREEEPPRLGRLRPALRGDLEAIAARALARDPAARYASASDLAADVRRFLAHEPVSARAPGIGRQLALLARRHRAATAARSEAEA